MICVEVPLMVIVAEPPPLFEVFEFVIFPLALMSPVLIVALALPLSVSVLFTVSIVPLAIVYVAVADGENSSWFIVTDPVMVQLAVNFIRPLLCVKLPLL